MSNMTDGLTFRTLRDGNKRRMGFFHQKDPTPWNAAQWLQAVIGELGEYANLRKKVERGDFSFESVKEQLASELADVVIYLDLLADYLGIDLGEAVMKTWNAKSQKLDIPMRIDAEGWYYTRKLTPAEHAIIGHAPA